MTAAWIYLFVAGLFEMGWAVGLKYTHGFTRLWPSVWTVAAMAASFGLLSQALKTIPLGTGYAVWTGIGAVGTAVLGIALFNESRAWPRFVCIFLIVAGIVGLKLFTRPAPVAIVVQETASPAANEPLTKPAPPIKEGNR